MLLCRLKITTDIGNYGNFYPGCNNVTITWGNKWVLFSKKEINNRYTHTHTLAEGG